MSLDVHFLLPLRYSITFIFNIKVTWNLKSKDGILMTEWLYIQWSMFIFCLLNIGKNYTIALTVYNLGSNSTCDDISLHDTSGNVISSHDASQFKTEMSTICSATIGIPDVVSIQYYLLFIDISFDLTEGYCKCQRTDHVDKIIDDLHILLWSLHAIISSIKQLVWY